MSDTDDGFDEEAVREELREKYGEDDRGSTERMSELLLQGATMTNQHCDHCGTPIFRYEGQSFCPNCQHAADQQAAQQQGAHEQTAQDQPQQQQADQQGADAPERTAQQPADGDATATEAARTQSNSEAADRRQSANSPQSAERRQPVERQASQSTGRQPRQPAREQASPSGQSPERDPAAAVSGEAADALESSIAALARRGASADDPRRAREFLEAAREAAEALDALHHNA